MRKQFHIIAGLFIVSTFVYMLVLLSFKVSIDDIVYDSIDFLKYFGFISCIIGLIYTLITSNKFNNIINMLKDEAMHDGMTGLLNHKFFEIRLKEEIDRSNRYNKKLTFLFLDLDKFKRINDTYGHQFGDEVLKVTASIIQQNVRNIDLVSRYGGEEFCVILVNANKKDSFKTAERIRQQVEEHKFVYEKINETLTISIGMGEYPTDANNMADIIKFSDHKMYMAKEEGRNCIR